MSSGYLKCAGTSTRRRLYAAILGALSASAQALPEGSDVVAGEATISVSGRQMNVGQTSDRVIIEYDSFNVEAGEAVNFHQPGRDSVALNRVNGGDLSTIHGRIQSNGQVYLINPKGVVFGEGAQVDVGGLVASTLDIANEDFLQRRDRFQGGNSGAVDNRGHLDAQGRVVLLAPTVHNSGDIRAAGEVILQAGNSVMVQPTGSEIALLVDDPELVGQVRNSGSITGSRVALVVEASAQAYDSGVNNEGLVRAVAAAGEGGVIELIAPQADVVNAGMLDANAASGTGGAVEITARRYAQTGAIEARGVGSADGGRVSLEVADTLVVHGGSRIIIDAGERGRGGKAVLYSHDRTWYRSGAEISARGGALAGDGGFVEVSGRNFIDVQGLVDVGADQGQGGLWYIDPTDIAINNGGVNEGSFTGSDPFTWTFDEPAPASAQIDVNTIENTLLNQGSVIIDTASAQAGAGDINVQVPIEFDGIAPGRTLTLMANRHILFQGSSSIGDQNPGDEGLNVVLQAGGDIVFADSTSAYVGTGTFSANAGGSIRVTDITSLSTLDSAISLQADALLDDGNQTTQINAVNGGLWLAGASGIDQLNLNTNRLGLDYTGGGTITLSDADDLTLTALGVGPNGTFNLSAAGNLTYTGTTSGDLDGATNATINLTAGGVLALNGDLTDMTGAIDHDVNLNLTAGTGLTMADGVQVHSGAGLININVTGGGATVTGLGSNNSADNAIAITLGPAASLVDAGDSSATDISASNGGAVITAPGGVLGLETDLARIDITATGGDITISDAGDLSALNLTALNSVSVATAGDFTLPGSAGLGANTLSVTAGGAFILPDAGLNLANALSVSAEDVATETNARSVALAAPVLSLATAASGGDLTVNTTTDQLTVSNNGPNRLSLTDSDSLTLLDASPISGVIEVSTPAGQNLSVAGDLELNGAAGGLLLSSGADLLVDFNLTDTVGAVDNSGDLSLRASGRVVFAPGIRVDSGSGDVNIEAEAGSVSLADVRGNAVQITAASFIEDSNGAGANITATSANLSAGTTMGSALAPLQVDVSSLALTVGEDAQVTNLGALSLTSLSGGGDVSLTTRGDLALVPSVPAFGGNASFTAVGGDIIVPDAGFSLVGDLGLFANSVRDGDGRVGIGAQVANLVLAAGGANTIFDVNFNQLVLTILGDQTVGINDADALEVLEVDTGGNLMLSAGVDSNLTFADAAPVIGGSLSLSAGNDVIIPASGLALAGHLAVNARDLLDDDNTVTLAADHAAITLQGSAASTLNTSLNSMELAISGNTALVVNEADGLRLDSLSSAGDVSLTSAAGDMRLATDTAAVAGTLALTTAGPGNLVLLDTGLVNTGDLSVDVAGIVDSDSQVSLGATRANIQLRASSAATTLNTTFDELIVSLAGGGGLTVTDRDGLRLAGVSSDGDASFFASEADLTLTATAPSVAGDFILGTTGSGDLVIADTGLAHAGRLTLSADSLRDSDNRVQLAASDAQLTLRQMTGNSNWVTRFARLNLNAAGAGTLTVQNDQALVIEGVSSASSVTFANTGALRFEAAAADVAGVLHLDVEGDLQLASEGLTLPGAVRIEATSLADGDGGAVRLSATGADVTLASAQPLELATTLSSLGLTAPNSTSVLINNATDLSLARLDAGNASTIDLTVNGVLTVPATGLSAPQSLLIRSLDLVDGDRNLSMQAPTLAVRLSNATGENRWNLQTDRLEAQLIGNAGLVVADGNGLQLLDLDGDGRAVSLSNGQFELNLTTGDLQIENDLEVTDRSDDGVRTGVIDLAVSQGDLTVGDARLVANNLVDGGVIGATEGYGIRLRLTDSAATARSIRLGSNSRLTSVGGDILLDSGTTGGTAVLRRIELATGALVEAYNDPADPATGRVLLNDTEVDASIGQQIGSGRLLAIVSDQRASKPEPKPMDDDLLDAVDDLDGLAKSGQTEAQAGPDAAAQYDLAFGACNENEEQDRLRCRIDAALKAFLSHWLVGGELPPKTEIR